MPKLIGPALISLGKYVMRGCLHGKELSAPSPAMYTATHEPWYWTAAVCVCVCVCVCVRVRVRVRVCIGVRVRRRNKEAGRGYSNQPQSFQRDFLIRKLITLHPNFFLILFLMKNLKGQSVCVSFITLRPPMPTACYNYSSPSWKSFEHNVFCSPSLFLSFPNESSSRVNTGWRDWQCEVPLIIYFFLWPSL